MGGLDFSPTANEWSSPSARRTRMTPSSRALLTAWSAAWDAPRFSWGTGHKPGLDHDEVAPLLKLAASCVTELLPHLRNRDVAPLGASHQLLVEALDNDAHGSALAEPRTDPEAWVRALTHATLQTGDGDYVDGLDREQLDTLMDKHCHKQLAEARVLLENPSQALKHALDSVNEAMSSLLQEPTKVEDLSLAHRHWALVRHLERIAEDAKVLSSAVQMHVEKPRVSSEAPVDPVKSGDDEAGEQGLPCSRGRPRTKSQALKSVQVEEAVQRIDERRGPVRELRKQLSEIEHHQQDDTGAEQRSLQDALQAVDKAYKRARHFGEDLVEEMLALDKLADLAPQDRSVRKTAIAGIESLLDDVDSAKARLSALQKTLQAQLEAADKVVEQAQATEAAAGGDDPSSQDSFSAADIPAPSHELWQQVRLPLQFASREERDKYIISASAPGLLAEELKITHDSVTLTISGLRVPTEIEETKLRHKLLFRLRQLPTDKMRDIITSPQTLADTCNRSFKELGEGQFGKFTESFNLPQDANTAAIRASYENGNIRLELPKLISRFSPSAQSLWDEGLGKWDDYGFRSGSMRTPAWGTSSHGAHSHMNSDFHANHHATSSSNRRAAW
mmetsp:Transcript_31636/g.73849  ORF Transcript_31636/g.73849 Transcript_31636/m.73849 type:complete len:618 (-) Transcript_31636:74-1927(-)